VTRHLDRLGLGQRRFLDPCGELNRKPGKITARWPGHMAHLDMKKAGRIPEGGGWRVHGRDSVQHRAADRAKNAGARRGYVYLHSIVDGSSRLAYTEPLGDEKGKTAAAFLARAKVWFVAHGITHIHRIVTDNGACYRSGDFARIVGVRTRHNKTKPFTLKHKRESGALPTHPRRGGPLRPRVPLRGRAISRDRRVEHPLQLPSPPQRRGRPTTSVSTQDRRHQRPTLIHLGVSGELRNVESETSRWLRGLIL
jgi:hypothetical protein